MTIKDTEMKKVTQSPGARSRRSSNGEYPEPTKSQEAEFDKEVKEQIGARANSVVEYADNPPLLSKSPSDRLSVAKITQDDEDSQDENAALSK